MRRDDDWIEIIDKQPEIVTKIEVKKDTRRVVKEEE